MVSHLNHCPSTNGEQLPFCSSNGLSLSLLLLLRNSPSLARTFLATAIGNKPNFIRINSILKEKLTILPVVVLLQDNGKLRGGASLTREECRQCGQGYRCRRARY